MIVIGAEIHKSTHVLAAVDGSTDVLAGEIEILAEGAGHQAALARAYVLGRGSRRLEVA